MAAFVVEVNVYQKGNRNGLFMHFCASIHEITQMQQEEKEQHQRAETNCMLMKIKTSKLKV